VVIICSQCGVQCEDDMRFCSVCGAPLRLNRNSNPVNPEVPSHNPHLDNNWRIETTENVSAPSLFETLVQAKTKENHNNNESVLNSDPHQAVVANKSNTRSSEVSVRPTPPPRTKIRQQLKIPTKKSDLPPAKTAELKELLRSLNKLDKLLEASAIMRRDGTILSSAVSNKYNEDMMSMVAMNIFDIAADSIKALSGGNLKLLHLMADNALVLLSWINNQTVLILITSPKSQVGLISMYSQLVSQKIDKVLKS